MPFKTNEDGSIASKDGLPVYVNEDGTETAVNFDNLRTELNSTRSEAKAKKEKIREFQTKIEDYQSKFGDIDPEKARKALEIMNNLDHKKLVEAGELDSAIKQAVESVHSKYKPQIDGYEKRLAELSSGLESRDSVINSLMIGNALSGSPYLEKHTNTTADVRQAILGKHFRVEKLDDGSMMTVAYDEEGNKIFSPNEPGRLATTEEAISILWNRYPHKDTYAKSGISGSSSSGNPGGLTGKNSYTRNEWNEMLLKATREEKAIMAQKVMKKEVTIR